MEVCVCVQDKGVGKILPDFSDIPLEQGCASSGAPGKGLEARRVPTSPKALSSSHEESWRAQLESSHQLTLEQSSPGGWGWAISSHKVPPRAEGRHRRLDTAGHGAELPQRARLLPEPGPFTCRATQPRA